MSPTLTISIATYITMGVGVVQTMILSRALGPEGVGQLAMFRQLLLFGAQLASAGLPMAMIHAINKKGADPRVALKTVFLSCMGLAVIAVLLIWSILVFGTGLFPQASLLVLASPLIWIPFVLGRAVHYNCCAAFLQAKEMALISTIPPFCLAITYLTIWFFGEITVDLALFLEAIISGFLSFLIAKRLFKMPEQAMAVNKTFDIELLRSCVPFGLSLVMTDLLVAFNGYVSLLILRFFDKSFETIGFYSRGIALATIAVISVQSLQRFFYAKWAKIEGKERATQVERTVNVAVSVMIILGVGVVVFAEHLTLFLYGEKFLPAVPVVYVAIIGVGIYIVPRLLQSLFSSVGDARLNVIVLTVGVVTNVVFGVLTIPQWAEIGAVWSLAAGNACMAGVAVCIGCVKFQLSWRAMLIPSPKVFIQAFSNLKRSA